MHKNPRFWGVTVLYLALLPNIELIGQGQTIEVIHSFNNSDGANPEAALTHGNDAALYGTTHFGGRYGKGTVFQIRTDGSFSTLASFNGTNGSYPSAGLTQALDGNLYGTTTSGGLGGYGTVFRMATNGELTTLISFNLTNGGFLYSELMQTSDGNFYGTTSQGGVSNWGTVFQMTTNGLLTTLHSFTLGSNGYQPNGGLVQANDGYLYGTTTGGGGTIFRITTNGELTTLVVFDGTNGAYPRTGLIQANDGLLYGTTSGTLYRIGTNGTLTNLVFLTAGTGYQPGPLTQMSDGCLYGANSAGGAGVYGTAFRMTTKGILTTLALFDNSSGGARSPHGGLVQGIDGNLYGTSNRGGKYNGGGTSDSSYGTVFRILPVVLNAQKNENALILSWPTNAPGFILQSAGDLISSWTDFTNSPGVVGTNFALTNAVSVGSQFYRLKK